MPHRDERMPKTTEARAVSHDPLIEDDFEEDTPVFDGGEIREFDALAKQEAEDHAGIPDRGRDTEANEENSDEEDESAALADRGGDKVTKAADVTPRRRRSKKETDEKESGSDSA